MTRRETLRAQSGGDEGIDSPILGDEGTDSPIVIARASGRSSRHGTQRAFL
jgi:hypothetical protein